MDEPLSALDATTRRQVRTELRQTIVDLGIQTIVVTHDPVDALTLGDTICVMHEGRVDQIGSRHELLVRPRSAFVAEFMGVNLLSGTAVCDADGLCRIDCNGSEFVSADTASGEALLTVNPWDVRLMREHPAEADLNVMRGTVTSMIHLGPRTRVTVTNGVTLTAEVSHRVEVEQGLAVGDRVYACFEHAAARVYQ
jgi:ABC-type Fe3+/spermidine/putrescine transport system ATPase subunit